MTALTWTTLRDTLVAALEQAPSPYTVLPDDFSTLYTQAITYAEGRIYRDIVALAARAVDTSLVTVSGQRVIDLGLIAPNPIIVPEGFALMTPAGTGWLTGTMRPFEMATLDLIDQFWPTPSVGMDPGEADRVGRYWALQDNRTLVFAPTPDGAYTAVVTGLFQPTSLSSTVTSTYLSATYPDLLTAACMVFLEGALNRNFSAQADDPRAAVSWNGQYETLMEGAKMEEARRRGLTPDQPSPPKSGG
jgi:hypothetical protein